MSISTAWDKGLSGHPRRQWLLAFASGAALSLSFAPFYFWPLLFVCIPLCFEVLSRAATRRGAVAYGFAFGYGYFMAGTWWIANALAVDMAKFGWLIPISVLGLSAVMALYFALFGWLFSSVKTAARGWNLLAFGLLWVGVEYLRSYGLFGFPWNLLGYASLAALPVAQLASVTGVFGLSLLLLALSLWPLWAMAQPHKHRLLLAATVPLLAMVAMYGWGNARLNLPVAETATRLRIMQPNIAQEVKTSQEWQHIALRVLFKMHIAETGGALPPTDVTIWPETAYPMPIRGNQVDYLRPPSGILLTGALRVDGFSPATFRLYNSIVAINPEGAVLRAYDKHQLVPFGEFVPLRSVLPLDKITPGAVDFSRGAGPETVRLPDLPAFSPLVCYEVIFPWMAVNARTRPEWLVNVTNDGWYGDTPGPYQHLAMAQMRAIEQGLPLVRAANTGVSALIDPYGRRVASLPYNLRGRIDALLPKPLSPTMYARTGEWPALAIAAALGLGMVWKRKRRVAKP